MIPETPTTTPDNLSQIFNKEDREAYIFELEKLCQMYSEQIELLKKENELLRKK